MLDTLERFSEPLDNHLCHRLGPSVALFLDAEDELIVVEGFKPAQRIAQEDEGEHRVLVLQEVRGLLAPKPTGRVDVSAHSPPENVANQFI